MLTVFWDRTLSSNVNGKTGQRKYFIRKKFICNSELKCNNRSFKLLTSICIFLQLRRKLNIYLLIEYFDEKPIGCFEN